MNQRDLTEAYKFHIPTDETAPLYELIRKRSKELAELINELCPEGREKDLALMKVEESKMWANVSISRNS